MTVTKSEAAAILGRLGGLKGGKSTSKRKAAAARLNGQKGGWPKGKRRKAEGETMTQEEVSALQVGQPVIFSSGGFGSSKTSEIVQVTRRTLTQVVLSNGERINERGNVVGDSSSWSRKYVSVGTPQNIEEVRHGARKLPRACSRRIGTKTMIASGRPKGKQR